MIMTELSLQNLLLSDTRNEGPTVHSVPDTKLSINRSGASQN